MKKILFTICFLFLVSPVFASAGGDISFIYINGSNTNSEKNKEAFIKDVDKMHLELVKKFSQSEYAKKYFLENDCLKISDKPIKFYWGDQSAVVLKSLDEELAVTKLFSPKMAQLVRDLFGHCMHDAIWVQKYHNMHPILDELHKTVMQEVNKGNKVVLYGYSAGSFITYHYLLNRIPNINLYELFENTELGQEEKDFIKSNPQNSTCIDAVAAANLAFFNMRGSIVTNNNPELFKKNYMKINDYTKLSCIPENSVKGVFNFASPLRLFYPDIADPSLELTYYNLLLYKSIFEKGIFLVNINYSDDPLGFPVSKNLLPEEIEKLAGIKIDKCSGFIYDKFDTRSWATVAAAHFAYWKNARRFSNTALNAYIEGHKFYINKQQSEI